MTTDRGSGAQARTISVNPGTNRLNGPGVGYDGAGNLTAFPPYVYSWDPFNMMQSMQGGGNDAFHVYTADDERFCTLDLADPLNLFTYRLRGLDGQVVREFSLSFKRPTPWLWEKDWVRRDGTLLASASSSEGIRHYHPDHLGTPRLVTDAVKGVVAIQSFFPFGEQLQLSQTSEAMKFTGHERDYNTDPGAIDDLDYMHARYFSSMTGRMLSVDPIVSSKRNTPQSWNKYAYSRNNPLNFVDLDGQQESPPSPPATPFEFLSDFVEFVKRDFETRYLISTDEKGKISNALGVITESVIVGAVAVQTFDDIFNSAKIDDQKKGIGRQEGGSEEATRQFEGATDPNSRETKGDGIIVGVDKETGRKIILRTKSTDPEAEATIEEQTRTEGGKIKKRKVRFDREDD